MRFDIVTAIACLAASASAAPSQGIDNDLQARADRGHYQVANLGSRKQAILGAGGNTLDLAIAMLETETMTTDYPYGDGKTGDAANFGVFKDNWGMLRTCATRYGFAGQTKSQWNNGAELNSNIYADVASRWDCQEHYGKDKWYAGHRNGASGLANPYTQDIQNYRSAVEWIRSQIDSDSKYQSDNTRFWVDVPAI